MKALIAIILVISSTLYINCKQNPSSDMNSEQTNGEHSQKPDKELCCRLTSPELQQRKATVLSALQKKMTEKKELTNGYAFKFDGNDSTIDELTDFIKSERACCYFFTFNLKIADAESDLWLEISGPEGTKEFITTEMGL